MMIPAAGDTDGTSPIERIAIALESIANNLCKVANPPMIAKEDSSPEYVVKRCG